MTESRFQGEQISARPSPNLASSMLFKTAETVLPEERTDCTLWQHRAGPLGQRSRFSREIAAAMDTNNPRDKQMRMLKSGSAIRSASEHCCIMAYILEEPYVRSTDVRVSE